MRSGALLIGLCVLGLSGAARSIERVHSDLPLFTGKHDELQPTHFWEHDSFGCSSRIAFGDWEFKETEDPERDPTEWMRLTNYGVMHCAVIERWSHDRANLDKSGFKYSWFVKLDQIKLNGSPLELWLLQSGSVPGSDYLLLARRPEPGLIKSFDVLPVDCPREYERRGEGPDIWGANYCAINSAPELRGFARMMARRPRVGNLTWIERTPEPENGDR